MKALTLWQPWATLVAMAAKEIETRCWATNYRGELAIHSAAKLPAKWLGNSSRTDPFRDELADLFCVRRDRDDRAGKHVDDILRGLPYGKILCIVELLAIDEIDGVVREALSEREKVFGNYEDGRYAWTLKIREVFEPPIPAKGNRMLWNWEPR
jgi:activating signal cointegrator 1